jgi:uncharacterized Ntn-hydrolase superfamily protein
VTFSIVARDAQTGDLGVAVQSRFLAAGAMVCHARAGVGAVATQALANLSFGPRGLALLESGSDPSAVIASLLSDDELPGRRQVGIVDRTGTAAAHTGEGCQSWAGHIVGENFSCQGNILVGETTVVAMADVLRNRGDLPLPERLVAALTAGQAAGGDSRGQQSAALLVVREGGGYGGQSDRLVDLRVDDNTEPITELGRLLALHRFYFTRPADEDLIEIDTALAQELGRRLQHVLGVPVDADDTAALWRSLDRWAGRENLEERMTQRGRIDRAVLAVLRQQSGG